MAGPLVRLPSEIPGPHRRIGFRPALAVLVVSVLSCNDAELSAPTPVASVAVVPDTLSIEVDETGQFSATPLDRSGAELSGRAVQWAISDTAVATVSDSGLVTALVPGTAVVTATSEGQSGTASLTVGPKPVESVAVTPDSLSLEVDETAQLSATPLDRSGAELSGRAVQWAISDTAVATVSDSGLVTALVQGTAVVTATSEGQSGTASLTVRPKSVGSVGIDPELDTLAIGESAQFTASILDRNGEPLADRQVTWTTSDSLRLQIDTSGLATALAPTHPHEAVTVHATVADWSGETTASAAVQIRDTILGPELIEAAWGDSVEVRFESASGESLALTFPTLDMPWWLGNPRGFPYGQQTEFNENPRTPLAVTSRVLSGGEWTFTVTAESASGELRKDVTIKVADAPAHGRVDPGGFVVLTAPELSDFHEPAAFPDSPWRQNPPGMILRRILRPLEEIVRSEEYHYVLLFTADSIPGWKKCCLLSVPRAMNTGQVSSSVEPSFATDSTHIGYFGTDLNARWTRVRAVPQLNWPGYGAQQLDHKLWDDSLGMLVPYNNEIAVLIHEVTHIYAVFWGGTDAATRPEEWPEQVRWVAAGGHWGFAWRHFDDRRVTGFMYSAPLSVRHNPFDLYAMGLISYEEASQYTFEVYDPTAVEAGQPDTTFVDLTLDDLIEANRTHAGTGVYHDDGRRIPALDPEMEGVRALVVLLEGADNPATTEELSWVADIVGELPDAWHVSTWGRSVLDASIQPRHGSPPQEE